MKLQTIEMKEMSTYGQHQKSSFSWLPSFLCKLNV